MSLKKTDFKFYNFDKKISGDLALFFPEWAEEEHVMFISPHDDDIILGAGYLMLSMKAYGGIPHVAIMCDGRCGYSHSNEKKDIIDRRKKEAFEAYKVLGVSPNQIIRFDIADFCLSSYMDWLLPGNEKGVFEEMFKILRRWQITRMAIPNDYREHADHLAASMIGSNIGPQVGDAILADWGEQTRIKTYLKYSVWSDFNPLEPANLAVKTEWKAEATIREGISKFVSQINVIEDLYKMRENRKLNGYAFEIYRRYNPRPKLNLNVYKSKIKKIDKNEN